MRFLPWLLALCIAGCGDDHHADHDEDEHHGHSSPSGGTLVEIGDHFAQVDLYLDDEEGTLTLRVYDGHAEEPVRVAMDAVPVTIRHGGKTISLRLTAVADSLSGEKKGDTSTFHVQSDDLKGLATFSGTVGSMTIRGTKFASKSFTYGDGEPK